MDLIGSGNRWAPQEDGIGYQSLIKGLWEDLSRFDMQQKAEKEEVLESVKNKAQRVLELPVILQALEGKQRNEDIIAILKNLCQVQTQFL